MSSTPGESKELRIETCPCAFRHGGRGDLRVISVEERWNRGEVEVERGNTDNSVAEKDRR